MALRFERFHVANPDVYRRLYDLATSKVASQRARGVLFPRIGAKALWERMRWDMDDAPAKRGDGPALNNSFVSRYARLLMQEPGLSGVFETREFNS